MSASVDETSDAVLLAAHVRGDPDAFAELVARHQDRLWAVAVRTLGNPDDAADALQDAYISAFRRAATFRGDAKVSTWLHRIVINACLDRVRYRERRRTSPLDPADGVTEPDDGVEIRDAVAEALSLINPDQRAALILVDMQGYSVSEAAAMLGCAPGTVKSRCSRGRARLAPLLRDVVTP